jgi:hypothetical protein
MYNKPGLPPNGDSRTPDIIVKPNVGVVYTGSLKKQAEHGGFARLCTQAHQCCHEKTVGGI